MDLGSGSEDREGSRLELYLEGKNSLTEITSDSLNKGLGDGKIKGDSQGLALTTIGSDN